MHKKIIIFLLIVLSWFLAVLLIPFDKGFFLSLNTPEMLPSNMIKIIWIIIYLLNSLSIYILIKDNDFNNDYYFILIINYIFNETFPLFFSYFNSLLLSFISTIITTITAYFLYLESRKINYKSSIFIIPYILFSTISSIWIIIILILN